MTSSKLPDNEFADRATPRRDQRPAAAQAPATATAVTQSRAFATEPSLDQLPGGAPRAATPAAGAARRDSSAAAERAEIAERIAAFRNLQIRLKQDREDYYERTLARTRAVLASKAKPPQ